jgi:hypothetical protein
LSFTAWCNGNTAPFGGVIHGSNPCAVARFDLDPKVDRAALEAVWQAITHGKMINLISSSVAFVAIFLAAFGRLDPFDPRLMYL